ncbi:hypothetical protein MIND_00083500 [Mycena indigotica]|uniref:Uncharacterized protein n=1 Tax=Mycena indigotica TaxID=2126181 RepID=A0A8H6TE92_9AGAR|nr:uncharacterized protein MIND_00083500 [Mycena indigotica]KAF7315679.1 hypothetical protein MIND_00083500 [Mycena indigotica]
MPPKKAAAKAAPKEAASTTPQPAPAPISNALVPRGTRNVVQSGKSKTKRDGEGRKPTTARALILRNAARGAGEVMLVSKLLGREKLDLLLEDMIKQKAAGAIMTPFQLESAIKIADSQCSSFLDDIAHLQDPVLFVPIIDMEWSSRIPTKDPKAQEPLKSASAVARTVATRIHNTYMLAAAWKLVADTVHDLEDMGLRDDMDIKTQLKNDPELRIKYIALYTFVVNTLVKFLQDRFSVLATTTPHFAQYFKVKEPGEDDNLEEQCIFDLEALRAAGKSFLDSIILEISFPNGRYDQNLLMELLRDAVDEAPRDSKRFPQTLWDAVGDLSEAVRLCAMLEAPLLDPMFADAKAAPAEKLPGYDAWFDAMMLSLKATEDVTPFKDIIFPLAKAKKQAILETMWKAINQMYKASTKKDIDSLWRLNEALNRTPQWHTIHVPGLKIANEGKPEKKKMLTITEGGEDTDGSMPELQSVSNSSEEDDDDESESEDEEEDDGDETSSEYDEDAADEIRDQVREAMDAAYEGDLFEKPDETEEDSSKGNAFLKLLGSLRGRVFNSSTKLGGKKAPAARNPKTGFFGKTKAGPPPKTSEQPTATAKPKGKQAATVEEVDDDDDDKPSAPKKKKKKPKKKKKAAGAGGGTAEADGDGDDGAEETTPAPPSTTTTTTTSPTPTSPAKKTPVAKAAGVAGLAAQMSTVSLASTETLAQSAHSYLKSENLLEAKAKVKTTGTAAPEKKHRGFMSKFTKEKKTEEPKKPRPGLFSRLSKKATNSMHQLLRTSEDETRGLSSMKWETFVKLMVELGFTYDPGTAGSSVRFDPPDPKDVSITFHKPHPDPTIHPIMLREFAKRLKKSYGWVEADLLGHPSMV